jgi:hypothetical protein
LLRSYRPLFETVHIATSKSGPLLLNHEIAIRFNSLALFPDRL